MHGWTQTTLCRDCDPDVLVPGCEDEDHRRHAAWQLRSDRGDVLATVQQFAKTAHYYGTTQTDRTGPMASLEGCQARLVAMVERGD